MTARAAGRIRALLEPTWARVALLTLGLGMTVALSWFSVGGSAAYRGPMPILRELWLPLFGLESVLAAVGTYGLARWLGVDSLRTLVILVVAAWFGELVVLTVAGTIFANELGPTVAWFYWLIGTGGPVQPLAAIVGGAASNIRRR
jgi:hypothetical protein